LLYSVARAGFKNPCIPYEDTGIALKGFWSGFEPVAVVLSDVREDFFHEMSAC
jgi:hypothetical protein